MSPSHAVKSGKRYRYYITHSADLTEHGPAAWRMPAHDLEVIVVERLKTLLSRKNELAALVPGGAPAATISNAISLGARAADQFDTHHGKTTVVGSLVDHVRVEEARVELTIDRAALHRMLSIAGDDDQPLLLTGSAAQVRRGKDLKLVLANGDGSAARCDDALGSLLREALATRESILAQPTGSMRAIAAGAGQCSTRMAKLVRLSWLAPDLVAMIAEGRHPATLTPRKLLDLDLPVDWREQRVALAIA